MEQQRAGNQQARPQEFAFGQTHPVVREQIFQEHQIGQEERLNRFETPNTQNRRRTRTRERLD